MTTPNDLITLPLSVLRSLLFGEYGDVDLPVIDKPLSPLLGDYNKIRITHIAIGKTLIEIDKEERYFHVELFEQTKHCEIWLSFDWRESNARRIRLRETLQRNYQEKKEKEILLEDLIGELEFKLSKEMSLHLAPKLLEMIKTHDLKAVTDCLGVTEIVEQFKKKNNI